MSYTDQVNLADSIMFAEDRRPDDAMSHASSASKARSSFVPKGAGRVSVSVASVDALGESKRCFDEAMDVRSKTLRSGYTKYSATAHNPLRGAGRPMTTQSMRLAKIGLDGLHRHDLKPEMDMNHAHSINSYYMTDLVQKVGTTKPCIPGTNQPRPIFTVNGLQNHSSLPLGDPRVLRVVSYYRETYTHPDRRASETPQYDHVQVGEALHDDNDLGPVATKPFTVGAGVDIGLAESAVVDARRRYYRDAVEGMDIRRVDEVEKELRDKLRQSAMGPPLGGFNLRACYRFFDQDARGAIDLGAFKFALARLGLEWPFEPHLVVALYARYDLLMRGYVDFYQMINEIIGQDWGVGMDQQRKEEMKGQLRGTINALRLTGRPNLGVLLGRQANVGPCDVHALTDAEFTHRQRIRRVFRSVDRDNSGTIERLELDHLLVLLGVRVSPFEMVAIFDFLDADHSGKIAFDEFYGWYTATPPQAAPQVPPATLLERSQGLSEATGRPMTASGRREPPRPRPSTAPTGARMSGRAQAQGR